MEKWNNGIDRLISSFYYSSTKRMIPAEDDR